MIRFTFSTLILLALAATTGVAVADTNNPKPWYQIEVIIFAQPQSTAESSERWDNLNEKRTPINYEDSIEIRYPRRNRRALKQSVADNLRDKGQKEYAKMPVTGLQSFTFVPDTAWIPEDTFKRLNSSDQYKMLMHTAWIQPGLDEKEAISIHIHNHMTLKNNPINRPKKGAQSSVTSYPLKSNYADDKSLLSPSIENEHSEPELEQLSFNGTLRVFLARYLHADISLDYAPQGFPQAINEPVGEENDLTAHTIPQPSTEKNDELDTFNGASNLDMMPAESKVIPQVVYHLQQSRRMRSRKLHYIDHPKIGVLIKIMPINMNPQNKETDKKVGDS